MPLLFHSLPVPVFPRVKQYRHQGEHKNRTVVSVSLVVTGVLGVLPPTVVCCVSVGQQQCTQRPFLCCSKFSWNLWLWQQQDQGSCALTTASSFHVPADKPPSVQERASMCLENNVTPCLVLGGGNEEDRGTDKRGTLLTTVFIHTEPLSL